MTVGEICSREVYLAKPEQALVEAAREMQHRHIGALVVVGSAAAPLRPIGMLTDRDIVCGQVSRKADLHCLTVADVMSGFPLTLPEDGGLSEAIAALQVRGVRRAPVVSAAGDLVGIVTLDDLMPAVAAELNALANLMAAQASVETQH